MTLSILIPSVGGRDDFLAEVTKAFEETVPGCQIIVVYGYSWGEGINQLAGQAGGDYWLLACDDTKPWPGWFEAARPMVDAGLTPASRYFHSDGRPLHDFDLAAHGTALSWCRSFLITPEIYEAAGPVIDTTWYADFDYSERMHELGRQVTACDGYSFTHLPSERTWLTPEEDDRQRRVYEHASGHSVDSFGR